MLILDVKIQLQGAGYSSQDIIDLSNIFKTQLADFNYNASHDELAAEVHKIKGGLRLLFLEHHLSNLEALELKINNLPREEINKKMKSFITTVINDLDELQK